MECQRSLYRSREARRLVTDDIRVDVLFFVIGETAEPS